MTWNEPSYRYWQLSDDTGKIVGEVMGGYHGYRACVTGAENQQLGRYVSAEYARAAVEQAVAAIVTAEPAAKETP